MTAGTINRPFPGRPQPTHFRASALLLVALLAVAILGGGVYLLKTQQKPLASAAGLADQGMWPAWQAQDIKYPAVAPEPPHTPPPPRDLNAEKIARLEKELADHRAALDALKRQPAKPPVPVPAAPPKPKRHSGVDLTPAQPKAAEAAAPAPSVPTYTLAPGATKIACQIETAMHSEIPAIFTARVKTSVYDTATGQQLLVPQGATLLGKYDSGELLYGNERIPTWGLTLALPNGQSIEVGNAPVMDQVGMMGLSGEVNSHYLRSLAAVLIAGTLRGGSMALQASIAQSAGMGQVATGIAAAGSQYGQQAAGRAIDVRPTITVEAGQPCTVILTKALELPAYQVR